MGREFEKREKKQKREKFFVPFFLKCRVTVFFVFFTKFSFFGFQAHLIISNPQNLHLVRKADRDPVRRSRRPLQAADLRARRVGEDRVEASDRRTRPSSSSSSPSSARAADPVAVASGAASSAAAGRRVGHCHRGVAPSSHSSRVAHARCHRGPAAAVVVSVGSSIASSSAPSTAHPGAAV